MKFRGETVKDRPLMAEIEEPGQNPITERVEVVIDEENVEKKESKTMKPWDQHSSVISLPRYDYKAPSSLIHKSHSGFLITCSFKREKSATKEAISILDKVGGLINRSSEPKDLMDEDASTKRRKIGEPVEENCQLSSKEDKIVEWGSTLSLVKLTKSGLVLLTASKVNFLDTVSIVSDIFGSLESGNLTSPLWCHRIFPIQSTCTLNEKDLKAVVVNLVHQFVNDKRQKLARPVKFAVGYNRRGIEEKELKILKDASKNSDQFTLLDRNKCFGVVAAAVKEAIPESMVDLKSPELCVLAELLHLSGIPNGSLIVGVSVLPTSLVNTKPKLCMKPLIISNNSAKT